MYSTCVPNIGKFILCTFLLIYACVHGVCVCVCMFVYISVCINVCMCMRIVAHNLSRT